MSDTTQLFNNGGSAFPLHVPGDDITEYTQQGMTLRDYLWDPSHKNEETA